MDPYLIMGHGQENVDIPFEDRKKMEPGYTLVTLATCGVSTTNSNVLPMLEAFHNIGNQKILSDPVAHKREIEALVGNEINIYTEGYLYPNLILHLLTYFPPKISAADVEEAAILRSGVFKFPMEYNDLKAEHSVAIEASIPGATTTDAFSKEKHPDLANKHIVPLPITVGLHPTFLIPEIVKGVYKDSILPTQEEVTPLLKKSVGFLQKKTVYPLDEAFKRGGPGVYYYVICRNPQSELSTSTYLNRLAAWSIPTPEYNKLTQDDKMNNAKAIEALMPEMVRLSAITKNDPNKYTWAHNNFLHAPAKFQQALNRTRLIRTASTAQQALNRTRSTRRARGSTRRRKRKRSQ